MTELAVAETPTPDKPSSHRRSGARVGLIVGVALFVAFWTWALFFASKQPINRIGDSAWAARAEAICVTADRERLALADFRKMKNADTALVDERADIVDKATDILQKMLDDVTAVMPTDAKGQDLVPQWEADYRTYIADRRLFTKSLRDSGKNRPFYESQAGGIPISEKLEVWAADNRMATCAPPRDLTR